MPIPTPEQLERINKFSQKELTADDVYVFNDLMIDDQLTAYSSRLDENLLRKFVKDSHQGVGLLMNHNNRTLPVGRSFSAEFKEDYNDNTGELMKTVYGHFYIDRGRKTESNMTTDDIIQGIESGTIFDTSIGFSANKWDCSVCGHDIRDYSNCYHIPGEKYVVEDEYGEDTVQTCEVIVGNDGAGELLENSLVYAGACNRATIKNNFSLGEDVKEYEKGTKLHLVENFKNIPTNATIFGYFTKDGSVLFTDTEQRTNGAEYLTKRSEEDVNLKEVLSKFNLTDNTEELSASLETLVNAQKELETTKEELATKSTELENVQGELANATTELEDVKGQLSTKDETITELTQKNEELTEKAELANTYRVELEEKALELGVRAQGNAFSKEMYGKFLKTLSIDEVKEVIEGFNKEVESRFEGARKSEPGKETGKERFSKEPQTKDDFESDAEFRNYVADKALEYSRENNVTISEATKLMFKKYSKDGGAE